MTIAEQIDLWLSHSGKAYAAVPANRGYAKDQPAALALAAVGQAWQERRAEQGKNFDSRELERFFNQLAHLVPEMTQSRPNEPKPLSKLPRDPVLGTLPLNPWITDDLASQSIVEERYPELAPLLMRMAKDGGYTFKLDAELADAAAATAAARAVKYGPTEHESNPFKPGGNRTAQAEFVKSHPAEVVEIFRREGQPLRLPWSRASYNMTRVGQLLRESQEIGEIVQRAQAIESAWIQARLSAAKEAEGKARKQREQAERLLQGA